MIILAPLPPAELSPNGQHGHWAAVAAARQEYRMTVYGLCLAERPRPASGPPYARVTLTLRVARHRPADGVYRPTDPDNLAAACKPLLDGLTDARAIAGDDWDHLALTLEGREFVEPGAEGIVVRVEAEPPPG